jgi:FtsP/CotA-like multicopper oxidase with cupredoxin domain
MPNQNPNDDAGAAAMGRWDYGPWFWPPMTSASLAHGAKNCAGTGDIAKYPGITPTCPGTLNPSGVPEAFMDTPVINGTAYPSVTLPAGAYRFQVLNAANDRMFNLSLFYAADKDGNVCKTGYTGTFNTAATPAANAYPGNWHNCTEVKMVPATPHRLIMPLPAPEATADGDDTLPACASSATNPDVIRGPGFLVTANPAAADYNTFTGLPGATRACWPSSWPTDGRDGGVPDPASAGPAIVQIGTEGGVLPAPVVIPATPVGYNYNRRDIVVTNVQEHALFLGPAERADIVVDLSTATPGDTLMLYNDSPAPVPGYDVRLDYYTGAPDLSDTGGAPITQAGYGPNIHTLMQIHIVAPAAGNLLTSANGYNLTTLQSATGIPKVFHDTQPQIIVPETAYSPIAMGTTVAAPKDTFARIQNTTGLTYQPFNGTGGFAAQTITQPIINKAIHELFESDYGKMNSILAAEIPMTNFNNQTTIPLAYVDPPTEIVNDGQVQLWKITHNGVDSHAMHFHLFDVQLINRVGWDGAIRAADANELGWKETVRMNPLEDAIVAIRPVKPPVPNTPAFLVPSSSRLLDPSRALHATNVAGLPGFTNVDPATGNPVTTSNEITDFSWEYVWHCHLLGHEESDMMRPLVLKLDVPDSPTNLVAVAGTLAGAPAGILTWSWTLGTNNIPATGFLVQRAPVGGAFVTVVGAGALPASARSFTDTTALAGSYVYRVYAFNANALSGASNTSATVVIGASLAAPTNLRTTLNANTTVTLAWTDANPAGANAFSLERQCVSLCGTLPTTYTVIATVGVTTLSYTNRNIPAGNLPRGAVFNYRVRATGPNGAVSPYSNVLPVTVN